MADDPDVLMRRGQLLKDLRFRFGACAIRIPSLSERRLEIPVLAQRALENSPTTTHVSGPNRFSDAALVLLSEGEYEGNVRQLIATVEYAYLMARAAGAAEIGVEHLPEGLSPPLRYERRGDWILNQIAVERALSRTGGNIKEAARLLGISRNGLQLVLKRRKQLGVFETSSRSRTCHGVK